MSIVSNNKKQHIDQYFKMWFENEEKTGVVAESSGNRHVGISGELLNPQTS